jgi:NADH dehydrogenase
MSSTTNAICVLGGTGFIGHHLTNALLERGYEVRLLTRARHRQRDLEQRPGLELVEGDVHDIAFLQRQFAGQDAVINLIGELNDSHHPGRGFQQAHVELAHKVVDACQAAHVPRLLHMSALNARPDAPSRYLRSKGEAENHVHEAAGAELAVTSFRPSVVFGPGDGFFNRFAQLLTLAPGIMPLPGAKARFAPVYVGDVVAAMVAALEDPTTTGQRLDLCGPKDYTLLELVRYVARLKGKRVLILPLPAPAERLLASVMQYLPGQPLTPDNLDSMKLDSICPPTCPRQPTAVEDIVPAYLGGNGGR